ncbi:MAG: hypothetical protein AAB932_01195 [Patescibacteria group bacterium]
MIDALPDQRHLSEALERVQTADALRTDSPEKATAFIRQARLSEDADRIHWMPLFLPIVGIEFARGLSRAIAHFESYK